MIEDFTRTAITTLLAQGAGWAVAVLLGIWCYILDSRLAKLQGHCDTQTKLADEAVRTQYEKRLEEFRDIIEVMTGSTHTTQAMQGSVTATTDAINQLAVGFAKLLQEFNAYQVRWGDHGGQMIKQVEDIRNRIETLQHKGGATR